MNHTEPLPENHGPDVTDWLMSGHNADELQQIINEWPEWMPSNSHNQLAPNQTTVAGQTKSADQNAQANSLPWGEPEMLPDEMLPVKPLDIDLLPPPIRPWLNDIAQRMQAPVEFPAVAALVAASSVIGNRIHIRPKHADDWTVVSNLWGAAIGRPGVLKTPSLEEGLKPLRARERLAHEEYKKATQDFEFQQMVNEARRLELLKSIKAAIKEGKDGSEYRAQLEQLILVSPTEHRYIVNDPTIEKLGELLNVNPNGLLLFRDELVGWLKSLERDGREQDRSFYLETWTGSGSYVYDRIGRGTLKVSNLTLSVLGGIQPGPLMQYLRGAIGGSGGDDGLIQRFQLLVYPDPPTTWQNVDRLPDAQAASTAHKCFADLDTLDPEKVGAEIVLTQAGENQPGESLAYLRFDGEAQEFFDDWRATLEAKLLTGAFEHPALEAHMAKYRSLMPSLALIFHLMDRVTSPFETISVTLDAARRAAEWCALLEEHARRVYGLALSGEVALAKVILNRIRRGDLPPEFTARDIYRKHWAGLSKPKDVAEPLRILEDYGWLKSLSSNAKEEGGRPTVIYIPHPSLKKEE